jgi:hypothetical protein
MSVLTPVRYAYPIRRRLASRLAIFGGACALVTVAHALLR